MKFLVLESFRSDYKQLFRHIQEQVDKAILLLEQNPRHPSLRVKKIKGTRNVWEGRVTLAYRLTFNWEAGFITLRRVGTHDILKKEAR